MRILYIGSFRMPNGDAAAARVLNVARALRLAGNEVSFISWGGELRECDLCDDGIYRIDGFEYCVTHELDTKGPLIGRILGKFVRGRKTKQLLRERLGRYDAIISYNGNLAGWLIRFTEKHHLKLISDLTEWYDNNELKCTDWLPYAYKMRHTQKQFRNKIVISHYFDEFYRTTHNIVVPATCDSSEVKWRKRVEGKREADKGFEGITLIYAGTPAKKDALHFAINAVQQLIDEGANLSFIILGANREQYIKNHVGLLVKQDLSERIHFLGRVPQDEVPSYYAMADFMILLREPNRKSNAGFPTKFSESFTSGTPVIANITSDLGWYLFDGVTGFVVKQPSEASVYTTLKDRVINLTLSEIEEIKRNVREEAKRLDYHFFVEPLREFINELQ